MDIVGILTDTTASIPETLVKALGIQLVPYHIIQGKADFRDMMEVDPESFAEYLEGLEHLPAVACPGPGDYLDGLMKLAGRTKEIVVLTMTSKGSDAFQSCQTAVALLRERMPDVKVELVDTLQVAMSQGWAAVEAARTALEGLGQNEVVARAALVARKSLTIEAADTVRYLYRGGQIGRVQNWLGAWLKLKPIVVTEKGVSVAIGAARNWERAYARMVDLACQRVGEGARIKIAFTHVAAPEQVEELRAQFLRHFDCVEVVTSALSPALAVHSGPGTVGVNLFQI
jgi:DegV family protein with EDD domain